MRLVFAIVYIAVTFPPRIVRFVFGRRRKSGTQEPWEPQWLARSGDRLEVERFSIVNVSTSDARGGDEDASAGLREPLPRRPSGGNASAAEAEAEPPR